MQLGLFGKIPSHGDFIDRALPAGFISTWDEWLQSAVASSREQLGNNWLDIYLTSPIWHFVSSVGAVDNHAWAGVLVPSVDSVGRYFPLTIAGLINTHANHIAFISDNEHWFAEIQQAALDALQNSLSVDQLMNQLQGIDAPFQIQETIPRVSGNLQSGYMANAGVDCKRAQAQLLCAMVKAQTQSYSVWSCAGSERMSPSFGLCAGLPEAHRYAALLDGQFNTWGWQA